MQQKLSSKNISEGKLGKARDKVKSFHERDVLYGIVLEETPNPEIELELNKMWSGATDKDLLEWADVEFEKSQMPTFHPDEYLEYPHPVEKAEFFAQASEKRYQARKNLGLE